MKNEDKKSKKLSDEFDLENMEGVGPVTAKKLINAGITNLYDLVVSTPTELNEKTGKDKEDCEVWIAKAREILETGGFIAKSFRTAKQVYVERQSISRVTTGSKKLDEFLTGGLETGSMYEIYGEYGSGKTQLCHTVAVNCTMSKDKGGLDGGVLYVDTENTFRPERIETICKARGLDPEKIMDKIIVARAHNAAHQVVIMDEAGPHIVENKIKMIIVDSIIGNFRPEYIGRGSLAERQQLLNRHLHKILRIAENYQLVAIATNQAVGNPDMYGADKKAAGGHIMAHASTYRLLFKKGEKGKRIARMMDSPMHPDAEVPFKVTVNGIEDVGTDD